jgi:hypothetical protein
MSLLRSAEIGLVVYRKDRLRTPCGPPLKQHSGLLDGNVSRLVVDLPQ